MSLTSASNYLSLLDESDDNLKAAALERLDALVPDFWAEMSAHAAKIRALHAREAFPARYLAALVASKIYFHLGSYRDAMELALGAGKLFDVSGTSEYARTLVFKCVDEYTRVRQAGEQADARLQAIVDGMFARCFADGSYTLAVGAAIEARRLDKIEEACKNSVEALEYSRKLALGTAVSDGTASVSLPRGFRAEIFDLLARIYSAQSPDTRDYSSLLQCLTWLGKSSEAAGVLLELARRSDEVPATDDAFLLALQLAFDLCSDASQKVLQDVRAEVNAAAASSPRLAPLAKVLAGDVSINLSLLFLYGHARMDMTVLDALKASADSSHQALLHGATVAANALMCAGTTIDDFLRRNLEWLGKAANWAKFAATAALGVIHRGHLTEALRLLNPYLPRPGAAAGTNSPYSEGGAFYALGLIHANHGSSGGVTDMLTAALAGAAGNEVVLHGCCLGLGLAAMATGNAALFERLRDTLYEVDSAVAGEAAAIAMGLVMLGTANPKSEEVIRYAHEHNASLAAHERIIKGCVLGAALMFAGRQEDADTTVAALLIDKDAQMRAGGAWTQALAYCGTGEGKAVRSLLKLAVSDVSDDVRRAALTGLGFVLCRNAPLCANLVSLLTDSFNPHVRYGAAMALGISCAGTALPEATALLEPMTRDPADFVRQGAMVAMALVLMEASRTEPRAEAFSRLLETRAADKHDELMSRLGAFLATGVLNAGGRNVTLALTTASGHLRLPAIAGMAVFCQYWSWHPYIYFCSLALEPTAVIGVDPVADIAAPAAGFSFRSNARPSMFAYPPVARTVEKTAAAKGTKSELSYGQHMKKQTARELREREEQRQQREKEEKEQREREERERKEREKKERENEPLSEVLKNPARVTVRQRRYITFDADERYAPVKRSNAFGVVVLKDSKRGEAPAAAPAAAEPATTGAAAPAAPAAVSDVQMGDATGAAPAPPAPFKFEQ
eukprot:m51a1_g13965 putative 26s proteasome non-atpase regulatory subunit 1 homolog a-like (963) ;mRNA; f:968077-971311